MSFWGKFVAIGTGAVGGVVGIVKVVQQCTAAAPEAVATEINALTAYTTAQADLFAAQAEHAVAVGELGAARTVTALAPTIGTAEVAAANTLNAVADASVAVANTGVQLASTLAAAPAAVGSSAGTALVDVGVSTEAATVIGEVVTVGATVAEI